MPPIRAERPGVPASERHIARSGIAEHPVWASAVDDSTERLLAAAHEAALQEGLRLYETMFERSSLGQLIVDFPSFRIDVVNPALCRMTGRSVDQLVGREVTIIFPVDQNPASATADHWDQRSADGYEVQRLLQRRDGTMLPVVATVSVVRDGEGEPLQLLTVLQDRTQQRSAENAQRRSQALIDAAIAALPMTFTAFNLDLEFTYVAGGLDRPGTQSSDFLGRRVTEFTADPATLLALRDALAGRESTTRTMIKGETYLTLHGPLRDDDGEVVGAVGVSTNITTQVAADVARAKAEELRLFLAQHDPLTGLPGRTALTERLNRLALARQGVGALLLLDLDDFKLINSTLGYDVGDGVLLEVAKRFSEAFAGSMVARCGADEFAVEMGAVTSIADASAAAQTAHAALEEEFRVGGHLLRVTAAVGIAIKQASGSTSTLIGNAETALAHAKHAGAAQSRIYDAQMRRELEGRLRIQLGLRTALHAGQMSLAYQPVVRLADRVPIGTEALLRWTHPMAGVVSPDEFIPIAEQSGLIVPIGRWVIATACRDTVRFHRQDKLGVSVNVSVRQLVGGGFAESVEAILEETGLAAGALTLEVTEGALMEDVAIVRTTFDRLRSRGVRLSIDDFGTGYSSLARLQDLPVDEIKLDRAFVTDVNVRDAARRMAAAIFELSLAIDADIVAEGVETEAEAETLLGLGYTRAQGYLFAPSMPAHELARRLEASH